MPRHRTLTVIALFAMSILPASGQTINEDIKIVPSGLSGGFGFSIAVSGTTAIVGPLGHLSTETSGWVNLFDTETGQELFRLTAHDAADYDNFGRSVAISGTTVIVGSLLDDDAGSNSGSAYLFSTVTGQQLFKLTASDATAGDKFGRSVGISGTTAIVGSYSGAYLFDTETGQQLLKLTDSDSAVAISGTTAMVGSRLFDTQTGQQLFQLTTNDGQAQDRFGYSVAISGTTAIVGAMYTHDPNNVDHRIRKAGAAYLFDTETGQQLFRLTAFDAANQDRFGGSVSISGTTAIVGAEGNGSAYLFDTETGQKIFKLTPSDGGIFFGFSVGISGTTALAGAYRSGAAYLFDFADPCTVDLNHDEMLNFLDVSAFLAAFGAGDSLGDYTCDNRFNYFDVSAFLAAFGAGCP